MRASRSSASATPVPAANPAPSQETHHFEDKDAWETWLQENYSSNDGVWLQLNKKGSTVPAVTYDEALDVALCFGWIDGQKKTYDTNHFIQRFTPRRKNSLWSQRNVTKVAALIAAGHMRPSGQAEIDAAKTDGRWGRAYAGSGTAEVPADFQAALNGNKKAREFWETLGRTQRYKFVWRIETTKRAETRKKKIGQFVELLQKHECL